MDNWPPTIVDQVEESVDNPDIEYMQNQQYEGSGEEMQPSSLYPVAF